MLSACKKITREAGELGGDFGFGLVMSPQHLVVGDWSYRVGGTTLGAAYVFTRSGESWIRTARLTSSDGGTFEQFGRSVAVGEEYIAVGAPLDGDFGRWSGSAITT